MVSSYLLLVVVLAFFLSSMTSFYLSPRTASSPSPLSTLPFRQRHGRLDAQGSGAGEAGSNSDDLAPQNEAEEEDSEPAQLKGFSAKRRRKAIKAVAASLSLSTPTTSPSPSPQTPPRSSGPVETTPVLKASSRWACIKGCGACCYLQPSERPDLDDYFDDPDDLATYHSLVGEDGWCKHFDQKARACKVYADRPWFCRVEQEVFERMYGVEAREMDRFCTACCREQIGDAYGVASDEMKRFNAALKQVKQRAITIIDPFTGSPAPMNVADWC